MIVDVSMTITEGSVFRRGTPPVQISAERFYHESEGDYESIMFSLSAHTATHLDLVFREKRFEPERMIGRGRLIDVSQLSGRKIQMADVEHQVPVDAGDFVLFRTDWSRFVGTQVYHDHPELSLEVVGSRCLGEQSLGHTKVGELNFSLTRDENVVGADITVEHASFMSVAETEEKLARDVRHESWR